MSGNGLTAADKEYFESLITKATDHSTDKIKQTVEKTMKDCFKAIGIDIEKPFEAQKDQVWVREMRIWWERFRSNVLGKLILYVLTGSIASIAMLTLYLKMKRL